MALIAVTTAGRIHIVASVIQATEPAAEAIVAGAPVRLDDTLGTFTNSNGTAAGEADTYGIATRSVAAGETVTAIRKGVLDGFTFTQAYGAPIYVADTDGRLGDVAGTVSVKAGNIVPGFGEQLGAAPAKLLFVDFNN